ncbi:DNA-processing protein DprA [Rhodoferax sp.]|uniref:DNA-processing protein DprA n=1 Tax=Rhodoferax sp. TaxID=50421 RepID=UPI00261E2B8B|nr:DNA-processing protein DprA [Rhodoferax sp.]MDD2810211.1 DNA-processing protein DprA [Rhodoferax sp.]
MTSNSMTIDTPHSTSMVSELMPTSSLVTPPPVATTAAPALSPNTQAILLLTAPLITGHSGVSPDLLTPGEYKRLARHLRDSQHQPMDLIAADAYAVCASCHFLIEKERLQRLLSRGFLLSQALEQWQSRAIWVLSRADALYPRRLKTRLREDAPAVLYGCGDLQLLEAGGLAVVGSRHVDDSLIAYTEAVGTLAASAQCHIVSGGAKGIDQAAMRGALQAGGKVTGMLADSLQRAVMLRDNRDALLAGRLLLMSPWDPSAGFNVGHAMQRNKLIYALADAALVVSSDVGKGGTWAGATEQLDKLRLVPVYVRSTGTPSDGLEGLRNKGALPWPEPQNATELNAALDAMPPPAVVETAHPPLAPSHDLPSSAHQTEQASLLQAPVQVSDSSDAQINPAKKLLDAVTDVVCEILVSPKKEAEIAALLDIAPTQARAWLQRLVNAGVVEKKGKPAVFGIKSGGLFH